MQTTKHKAVMIFFYTFIFTGIIGIPISFFAFGSDFKTQQNPLYPYKSSIFLQDEFASGSQGNGTVGSLGWNFVGGTTSVIASPSTNRIGVVRRDTTAVSGTLTTLTLYQGSSTFLFGSTDQMHTFLVRLNTNDANTTARIGTYSSTLSNPPADGIYFEKLDADTNWFCVTRAGGVQTRTDSIVTIDTNFNQFEFIRNSSGVTYKINSTPVCSHTTNISTVGMNPGLQIINSAAAAKTVDIDYYQVIVTGLTR